MTGRREPTRRDGLTEAEVAAQRVRVGPNEMPPPERVPAWRKLVAQFVHFFALTLWAAGVLAHHTIARPDSKASSAKLTW